MTMLTLPASTPPVCPDLAVVLYPDGHQLDFLLVLYKVLGPWAMALAGSALLAKLLVPAKYSRHAAKVLMASLLFQLLLLGLCPRATHAQASPSTAASSAEVAVFTVPASADEGQDLLPNIYDPDAVDAQTVCPGYTAANVQTSATGLTADLNLAGPGCSAYGNDIENLTLTIEYQDTDRLHIEIQPRFIGSDNETWFVLPDVLVPKPTAAGNASADGSDFVVSWTNDPSFSFTVTRKSTNDTLFTTAGSVLVYEDQFIEFVSALPENYNLYGLGEVIHGLRLGNNLTSKFGLGTKTMYTCPFLSYFFLLFSLCVCEKKDLHSAERHGSVQRGRTSPNDWLEHQMRWANGPWL